MFLIDACGALATTLFFLFLLIPFRMRIGMPLQSLIVLASIAGVLFIYSISCYTFIKTTWKLFLIGIILANSVYCFISFALLAIHYDVITSIGKLYFITEIGIIGLIISLELKSYKAITS